MVSQLDRVFGLLQKSMSVNRLRDRVITNNIVNSEVPGFKRTDVNFEAQLKRVLDSEEARGKTLEMLNTDPLHFSSNPSVLSWDKVQPRVVLDYQSTVLNNGNNVDLEKEIGYSTKNSLSYTLLTELVRFQFNQINMVIK